MGRYTGIIVLSLVSILSLLLRNAHAHLDRRHGAGNFLARRQSGTVKFPEECTQECGPVQTAANCGNNQCGCTAEAAASLSFCEACLQEIVRHQNAENAINAIGDSTTPQSITPSINVPTEAQYEAACANFGFPIPGSPQAGQTTSSMGGGSGSTNSGSGQSQSGTPNSGMSAGQAPEASGGDSSSELSSASDQGSSGSNQASGTRSLTHDAKFMVIPLVILCKMHFI